MIALIVLHLLTSSRGYVLARCFREFREQLRRGRCESPGLSSKRGSESLRPQRPQTGRGKSCRHEREEGDPSYAKQALCSWLWLRLEIAHSCREPTPECPRCRYRAAPQALFARAPGLPAA